MSTDLETIERFYAAFAARDGDTMAACYSPGARFSDPVFVGLHDPEPGAMWRMLSARAKDFSVELLDRSAAAGAGTARWVARYTFAQTGRPVTNDVRSTFRFDEVGLIAEQRDDFDFRRWSKQALGTPAVLLGWTPLLQKSVQRKARSGLDQFMARA
jgi:limonene-1,2-epoxide hydrolase